MNILYVLNSGNPGGMEYHVLDLVKGMTERGHKVFVWCNQGQMFQHYIDAGAESHFKIAEKAIDFGFIKELKEFLQNNKIDVVHAHEVKSVTNSLLAAKLAKTPVKISHTHTPISEWQVPKFNKFRNILVNNFVVNFFSTKEIALTESRKIKKQKEGIRATKLEVIPNGVNVTQFDIPNDQKNAFKQQILARYNLPHNAFIFGLLSRMTLEKDHKTLLKAFSKFLNSIKSNKDREVFLLLAGGGDLEMELKALAAELNIAEKTIFTGRFTDFEKVKYYSCFDVFVFPSKAEGFGIVLIESLAAKIPVIASNLPVLKEVAEDKIDYFEVGNVQQLQEKMLHAYNNYEDVKNNINSAFDHVYSTYSIENFLDKYEVLYSNNLSIDLKASASTKNNQKGAK